MSLRVKHTANELDNVLQNEHLDVNLRGDKYVINCRNNYVYLRLEGYHCGVNVEIILRKVDNLEKVLNVSSTQEGVSIQLKVWDNES